MLDLFHAGIGWRIAKNYYRFTLPTTQRRIAARLHQQRKSRRPARAEDLDVIYPDHREDFDTPIEQIRYVSLRLVQILQHLGERHGFSFQLAYGTLLGAVRHGGFIPWDDDVDILMTPKDLDKFLSVAHELPDSLALFYHNHEFYKLMDRYSDVNADRKEGICLDIFILKPDGPDNYRFLNVHGYRYKRLPADLLFPLKTIAFEGCPSPLPVPAQPEAVLEAIYGDWRKLPPEEQRVYPHIGQAVTINPLAGEPLYPHPSG